MPPQSMSNERKASRSWTQPCPQGQNIPESSYFAAGDSFRSAGPSKSLRSVPSYSQGAVPALPQHCTHRSTWRIEVNDVASCSSPSHGASSRVSRSVPCCSTGLCCLAASLLHPPLGMARRGQHCSLLVVTIGRRKPRASRSIPCCSTGTMPALSAQLTLCLPGAPMSALWPPCCHRRTAPAKRSRSVP
jgi:hypothetical protein